MAAIIAEYERPLSYLRELEDTYGVSKLGIRSPYGKAAAYVVFAALVYAVIEQVRLARKRRHLPGPRFAVPFFGCLIEMIVNTANFWDQQRVWATSDGLSWNSLLGIFTVFSARTKISRYVLSHNSPSDFMMWLHPNGTTILGENNIGFMNGADHKVLRKSFLNLFTRRALSTYLSVQENLIKQHIAEWVQDGKRDTEMRLLARDLNLMTSQTVFVGPYLEDPKTFSKHYLQMTLGFLSLPINFPGTGLWKAVKARKEVQRVLTRAVRLSKEKMGAHEQPQCLLDFWTEQVLEEIKSAESKGEPLPHYSSDFEMACVVMDFLFASQDASTASITQTVAILADRPDVLEKVRKEQEELNPERGPLTYELVEKMVYTRQVMKEILRYRPPAPMVIQKAMRDIPLTDNYVCPKGAIVCPSITAACLEGFTEPEKFDPDRMGPERREDVKHSENFLVFGVGPHMCVGKEYAMNHLTAFISLLATSCDWTRKHTPNSHKILYLPTIYPADCLVTFKAKQN